MIITRFAPSPTGNLHIGGLRTALFNYLYARANQGKFLLRIEDTDFARNSVDAKEGIIQAFEWIGLDYDDTATYQSQRMEIYKKYIQKLLENDQAYYCYMSKEELDTLREEQKAKGETPRYDRRYRDFKGDTPKDRQPAIRIKAPLEGAIVFEDGIKGLIVTEAKELDDFIIARSDGTPTYNFTVAIDDALMHITHVIRGDDHLSNTPKQILIYNALGFSLPKFYHIPMILNPEGKKLSKRDGAMGVMDYKNAGYLPEAMINFLVRLGWSHGDDEIFSLKELLEYFDCHDINSSPSAYNQDKFLWLNHHYLSQKSDTEILKLLENVQVYHVPQNIVRYLFSAIKERSKTLQEFKDNLENITHLKYDSKMLTQHRKPETMSLIDTLEQIFTQISFESPSQIQTDFNTHITPIMKPGKSLSTLRLALLGQAGGVPLFETLMALGQEESLRRIHALKTIMQQDLAL